MHQFRQWIVGLGIAALLLSGCGDDEKDEEQTKPLDVSKLNVISIQELDMLAGPGRTSAYLAPDGESFAYVDGTALCLYTISGEQQRCIDLEEPNLHLDNELTFWSPDSRHLILATDFLRQYRDPDIWVADMRMGTLTNLTDDNFEGSLLLNDEEVEPGFIDLGARFINEGQRLVFVRYPYNREQSQTATIMSMKVDGSDLKEIGKIQTDQRYSIFALDQSPARKQWAYNYFPGDLDDPNIGTWVTDAQFEHPRKVGVFDYRRDDETITAPAWWVEFSADGQYLMSYSDQLFIQSYPPPTITPEGEYPRFDPKASPLRIFNVKDGQSFLADETYFARSAAWAPDGHAYAYIVTDQLLQGGQDGPGLYLSAGPGEPGRLVLPGMFLPPTSMNRQPLTWASNNTILLGSFPPEKTIIVQLGEGASIAFTADATATQAAE
ncbi:MAG TPA: hypothetical protein VHP83_23275 [Aggregatilineaceae bacterium]|nr:hypothetical protein [Aggregatilineaceae bacterium]